MNEAIERGRKVALGILNPTRKELDRGLALHEESLVVESYSLGLKAPFDGESIDAAIQMGATENELEDLFEDHSMTRWATVPELSAEFGIAWEASGVTCSFQNAGEEGNDPQVLMKRLARHTFVTDLMPDLMRRVIRPEDIEKAKKEKKHCFYMTGNGVPLAGDERSPEEELRYIRVFFQLGIRMMHLTYNRRNPIGDGCAELANAGLSDFGKEAVKELNRIGVIIDVSHTGRQTSLDAISVSDHPVIVSHSCVRALNEHVRCKDDELIEKIIASGGTMGITNVPYFLGGRGDIHTFLDHIEYVAEKFGTDHVTIGTDRPYVSLGTASENSKFQQVQVRNRWEALWPPEEANLRKKYSEQSHIESLKWTNWPLFTVGLVQRGFSDEDIRKIIGGNIIRVAREVFHH